MQKPNQSKTRQAEAAHARPLSAQMEVFCQALAEGLSQADAYRRAYPRSRAWKPEAVHVAAARLVATANVSLRSAQLKREAAQAAGLRAVDVLEEVRRIVFSDVAKLMFADGRVRLPHELEAQTRSAVASFKVDEYGRIEYKFWDKNAAVEKAMKYLGLFEKDNRQKADPLVALLEGLSGNVVKPGMQVPKDGS